MSGAARPPLRLLLVTPNYENNSLGRTYCLWLLARELGWQATVAGVHGRKLWEPLRHGDFSADCVNLSALPGRRRTAALGALVAGSDVVVAVKPLATSLGVVAPWAARHGRLLVVDVDDPDLEVRATARPLLRRQRPRTSWGRLRELDRLRELTRQHPTTVSNPVLQQEYGGLVVPHVRPAGAAGGQRSGADVVVRFVGSPRGHKGVDVLRAAVARLAGEGMRLEVTADAPADAHPWESWLGSTGFTAGQALVATADVVALPSLPAGYALAQLPAKLMDAMVLGRAIVASDLPPVAWALGDTGLLVPPGDVDALVAALRRLTDPSLRRRLGAAAHARAAGLFTVAAVAPAFDAYVHGLLADARQGRAVEHA